jgi:hypothetical protein
MKQKVIWIPLSWGEMHIPKRILVVGVGTSIVFIPIANHISRFLSDFLFEKDKMPAKPKNNRSSKGDGETFCDPLAKIDMEEIRKFHASLGTHFHNCLLSIPKNVDHHSIVSDYKFLTDQFIERLKSMVPDKIFKQPLGKAMRDAAEYVMKENIEFDEKLLDELWTAIIYRTHAAETLGGGDAGHFHMLKDLRYCMTTLSPELVLNTYVKDQVTIERSEEIEIAISSMKVRVDTIVFFMILNELAEFISQQFVMLRTASLALKEEKQSPDSIIRRMMEVTFAVNFAIHRVVYIEKHFVQNHPYLNTMYRMLALLCLHVPIRYVTNEVRRESPIASTFSEEHAVAFLGDILESAFRHPSDPQKNSRSLVREFREQWQLSGSALGENLINYVDLLVIAEAPLQKQQKSKKLKSFTNAFKITSHSWLSKFNFLGGRRSITQTIRLLQYLSNTVQQGRLAISRDRSSSTWSDLIKPVSQIPVDMDSLLSECILPSLVNMCKNGMMSSDLKYEKELLPVFSQIKTFVQCPERPVSWSLAFTVQSILLSVYEMQGAHGWMLLSSTSRQTYQKYFQQLEGAKENYATTVPRPPPTLNNDIDTMCSLRHLPTPLIKRAENVELMSLWNPLCAGSFLTYIAFRGNLVGGVNAANCARIKVTLHLYNALLRVKAIQPGQVELVDWIFHAFKECGAMWNGPLPQRGQFQLRWWMAWGLSEAQAAQIQRNYSRKRPGTGERKAIPIQLEMVAKSFRRVCRQNFEDVKISKKSPTKRETVGQMETFTGYVKDTADAMKENERLLGTNIVVLGYYLNQFYLELFHVCGLMPVVEKHAREVQQEKERTKVPEEDANGGNPDSWEESDDCLKYQAMSHVFAITILRRLDNGDPFLTSKCAEYMIAFFHRIAPRDILWFSLEESKG